MSEPGDVVWADGQAWIRGTTAYGDHKAWWCHPLPVSGEVYRRLSEAEQADDFMWLVKDGIPIVLNALAVYQALDSFADFVAKRDADAELTAERDALLSRLADVRAELEPWGLERLARRDRTLAEQVHDIRQSWTALRDANRHNVSRADAAEQQLATAHAEHEKLLTDWARAREERDQALRGLADLQRLVAAAEANEPVLVHPDWRQAEFDELAEERDQLSQELATVLSLRQKLQRRFDDPGATMSDFDSLGLPCHPGMGCPCRESERALIVAWLEDAKRGDLSGRYLAAFIERGDHLRGDDE